MPRQRRVKGHCDVCMYDKVYDKCLAFTALASKWPRMNGDLRLRPAHDGASPGQDFFGVPGDVTVRHPFVDVARANA